MVLCSRHNRTITCISIYAKTNSIICVASGHEKRNVRKIALLIIDVQKSLDDPSLGKRNNPGAESNMVLLLSRWRQREWPIIHIRHCSVEPGSVLRPELPGNAFKEIVQSLPEESWMGNSAGFVLPKRCCNECLLAGSPE